MKLMLEENTLNVLIESREDQGNGVAVLRIVSRDGSGLPGFDAGAHIDVRINQDLVRQYSLSNAPSGSAAADHYRIGVLNDPQSRGGSAALFADFHQGKEIQISAPRNHFEVASGTGTAILVAGGIGVTPIISMAHELENTGCDFEIHYCLNALNTGAFVEELKADFASQLKIHCSVDKKFDPSEAFSNRNEHAHVYVCGPSGFMDWVIEAAKERGISDQRIHFEYFNAEVDLAGDSIEVYCSDSDKTVMVGADESIANALSNAGIRVDVSCEQGVCGTCITDVLEGIPDHRDQFLTDEEKDDNDQMALCCSRAKSPKLVIEI
ncbi:MAG: oxidoreductase [Arenicella sp.]|nr:oxidoreductase [Arenicella sp.]